MDYSLENIAAVTGGRFSGRDSRVLSVMTDSRHSFDAQERPVFVAVKGINHDGHRFIGDLYRRGVRAFIIEADVDTGAYPEAGFVRVGRSLHALQALAADYRKSFKGKVVGITGSAGKTTVKELIAQLAPEGTVIFRSPKSYNSQLGVPLSLLMMRGDEDYALIEAGISRPGEMERLAAVIRPDIGIFTGIGPEHGENFESPEQKAAEKAKLFAGCGTVIYDGSPLLRETLTGDYGLVDASLYSAGVLSGDETLAKNAGFALAFYEIPGVPEEDTVSRLKNVSATSPRLEVREGLAGSVVISDTDNTDINSLGIALDYLNGVAGERPKMFILSDIMFSPLPAGELYTKAASVVKAAGVDVLVGVGEALYAHEGLFAAPPNKYFFHTVTELLVWLNQARIAGMAVLVKGNEWDDFRRVTHAIERRTHTTVLEINLDAMIHNLNRFRSLLEPGTKVMAMVKAAGYGNGGFEVANMLANQGVDYLAVAFTDEGVRLREQGIAMPIVVLNADSDSFELMTANRLEPEIYNMESLRAFVSAVKSSSAENYPVHIKIDSGMHRLGFMEEEIPGLAEALMRERGSVRVRSVFSHLAVSDVTGGEEFTRSQIALFDRISGRLAGSLGYSPLRHIANSAATERFPEAHYDMVRLGIGLYGVSAAGQEALMPVSRMKTRIVQVKELEAGETVGYGRAGRLERRTRLAVLPVGYADGLDRRLGEGRWSVLTGGRQAPTVGRISMDSCVVDITGTDASVGDEAVVFGGNGENGICEMASRLGTIPYEIMTSVPERVKRIFIKE